MKKAIIILGLLAITTISFAQTKKAPVNKPDTTKSTASVPQVPYLDIRINNVQEAKVVLNGLTAGYKSMVESDNISAKDFTHAQPAYNYLLSLIYKKWPELVPKQ